MAWTRQWEVEVLIPNSVGYVHSAMEATFQAYEWDEYGNDGNHLVAYISLGDNFVVNAEEGNEEGVDFYVLLCTQTSFVIEQAFTWPWR